MKCLYIKRTYITLDNIPNKISKIYLCLLATIINTLKKNPPKFKSKNIAPGKQKGEAVVYSVQQPINLILYRSIFTSIQY